MDVSHPPFNKTILHDDIVTHILGFIETHSVDLVCMRAASKTWARLIEAKYSDKTIYTHIQARTLVVRQDMALLMDTEYKLLPKEPFDGNLLHIALAMCDSAANPKWIHEQLGIPISFQSTQLAIANATSTDVLEWLKSKDRFLGDSVVFGSAVCTATLPVIQWLHDNGCRDTSHYSYGEVGKRGDLSILQWLFEKKYKLDESTMDGAIEYGNLNIIEWLFDNGVPLPSHAMETAALTGRLPILQWLKGKQCSWGRTYTAPTNAVICTTSSNAVMKGDMEVLNWLMKNGCPFGGHLFSVAVSARRLDVMIWLKAHRTTLMHPPDKQTFELAASNGDIPVMEWLLKVGCPYGNAVLESAVFGGCSVEVLAWLYERNFPSLNENTFSLATHRGDLDVMEWLWERKCATSSHAFSGAVYDCNIPKLNWLCRKGVTFDPKVVRHAMEDTTSLEVLQWLFEKECVMTSNCCAHAAKRGDLVTLKWLHQIGRTMDLNTAKYACAFPRIAVLRWLKSVECPFDDSAYRLAHDNSTGPLILAWLKEVGFVRHIEFNLPTRL
jgi:hypothetical protein